MSNRVNHEATLFTMKVMLTNINFSLELNKTSSTLLHLPGAPVQNGVLDNFEAIEK